METSKEGLHIHGEWFIDESELILVKNEDGLHAIFLDNIEIKKTICNVVNSMQNILDSNREMCTQLIKAREKILLLAEEANYQSARWHKEHITPIETAINNAKNINQ